MPYIPKGQRQKAKNTPADVGELTYAFYDLAVDYVERRGLITKYAFFAEVLGALEAAKLELYRMRVGPYEDAKREENGDV